MRLGSSALAGILSLALLAGCSGQSGSGGDAQASARCIPAFPRLFGPQPAPPKALAGPLNAAILSRFAIFRRSAPSGGRLSRELSQDYTLASYYPASVRRLTAGSAGQRYYVVPAYGRREPVVSAGCASAQERRELVEQQQHRLTEPVYCIVGIGRDGTLPLGCEPFAAVDEGVEIFGSGASFGQPIVVLVPDGVASVRISYRARAPIVVPVADNVLVFAPPPPSARVMADQRRLAALKTVGGYCSRGSSYTGLRCNFTHLTKAQQLQRKRAVAEYDRAVTASDPTRIEWLDRAGGLVRTLDPPTAQRIAATTVGDLRAEIGG